MFSESGKVIVTHHFSYILNCVASAAQQFGCTFQTYAPDKFADGEISECLYPAVEGLMTIMSASFFTLKSGFFMFSLIILTISMMNGSSGK